MRQSLTRTLLLRIGSALPVLAGVLILTFALLRALPGDPAVRYATAPGAGPDEIAAIRAELGLDRPVPVQFARYVAHLARGDLGRSMQTGQPVASDLARRLPATLELAALAFAMASGVALPLGMLAALHRGGWTDRACRVLAALGGAMPAFFVGLVLIYVFSYRLGTAPEPIGRWPAALAPPPEVTGFATLDAVLAGDGALLLALLAKMLMPAAAMACFAVAPLLRMTRGAMIDALDSDFVLAARACGLSRRRVVLGHALPNALLPVLATTGMVLSTMIGANVMIEKLFSWPGIGAYAVDSVLALDYAAVQGFVLVTALVFVAMTLVIDLVSAAVDPRYRLTG